MKCVIVYFTFRPPYCSFNAIDATIISIRDLARTERRTTEEAVEDLLPLDEGQKVVELIKHPTDEDLESAYHLIDMNRLILANV